MNGSELKNTITTNKGIALTELVISLIFLVSFGLIIASTSSLLNKLLISNDYSLKKNDYQAEINFVKSSMQEWANILSQPTYSKEEINNMSCSYLPKSPNTIWNIPHKPVDFPPKIYKFCILSTSIMESDIRQLLSGNKNSIPGIYILHAKPDIKSSNYPFIRIIFCRPRVFCKA